MARTNGLYAEAVDHVAAMPEYPNTSDKGIAYCVDVTGMDKAMAKELHENVSIIMCHIRLLNVYEMY